MEIFRKKISIDRCKNQIRPTDRIEIKIIKLISKFLLGAITRYVRPDVPIETLYQQGKGKRA